MSMICFEETPQYMHKEIPRSQFMHNIHPTFSLKFLSVSTYWFYFLDADITKHLFEYITNSIADDIGSRTEYTTQIINLNGQSRGPTHSLVEGIQKMSQFKQSHPRSSKLTHVILETTGSYLLEQINAVIWCNHLY